jgi:hypothetical protein
MHPVHTKEGGHRCPEYTFAADAGVTTTEKTMKRRKFLIGMGSIAAGSAATIGSGAFDRVSASRTMQVNVVGDAAAYLALGDGASPYATYNSGGLLELHFNKLNGKADSEFFDVFTIKNQGHKEVGIFLDEGSKSYAFQQGNGPAEQPSEAGSDGIYNKLREAGFAQSGWFDEELTTGEDINGPRALPSGYRSSSSNPHNRVFDSSAQDHILAPGEKLRPDWYIFDTDADAPDNIDGKLVILAYSKDFVEAGKGP